MPTSLPNPPPGYRSINVYLYVDDGAAAIDFYIDAFGATERMRLNSPDGTVSHAELEIGDSVIMLADEFPDMDARSPRSVGGTPMSLVLYVDDADETVARALAAGSALRRPVEDQFYGDRSGQIEDPFGHIWNVATHVEDITAEEMARRAAAAAADDGSQD